MRRIWHIGLSVFASPMAGGLLLAARAALDSRRRLAAAIALCATGATLLGVAWAALAPIPIAAAALSLLTFWGAGGLLLAGVERRYYLDPEPPPWEPAPILASVLIWGGATLLAAVVWTLFVTPMLSPSGWQLYAKPSFATQVLALVGLMFVPGALLGVWRWWRGTPLAIETPAMLALSSIATPLAMLLAAGTCYWLLTDVANLELISSDPQLPIWLGPVFLRGLPLLILPLGVGLHLAESRGVRRFLLRWLVACPLLLAVFVNSFLWTSVLPLSIHSRLSERAAARGRFERAAKHRAWMARRAARVAVTPAAVAAGARDALLGGDAELARRLLASADDLARRFAIAPLDEVARRIGASAGSPAPEYRVGLRPLAPDEDDQPSWMSLLAAVSSARPELAPTDAKRKLLESAWLPSERPVLLARIVAGLFDLEVVPLSAEHLVDTLAAGVPVLFLPSDGDAWRLLFWAAPDLDAAIWLDYSLWNSELAVRNKAMSLANASTAAVSTPSTEAVLANVGRLGSISLLQEELQRDAGFALALQRPDAASTTYPGDDTWTGPSVLDLDLLEEARTALGSGAYQRALDATSRLPPLRQRDELLARLWLEHRVWGPDVPTEQLDELVARGPSLYSDLLGSGLATASDWALEGLMWLGWFDPDLACQKRRDILASLVARHPNDRTRVEQLLEAAVAANDGELAARAALDHARLSAWSSNAVIDALDRLTTVTSAEAAETVRSAVSQLLAKTTPLMRDQDGLMVRPSTLAAYNAGRATASTSPASAVRWWQRAVERAPKRAAWRLHLALALEQNEEPARAAAQRNQASALDGLDRCAAPSTREAAQQESLDEGPAS